jgi:TPP-dependent 2-oxoacid decarboxylase
MAAASRETVAALLARRLYEVGVTHCHGVPGDYRHALLQQRWNAAV